MPSCVSEPTDVVVLVDSGCGDIGEGSYNEELNARNEDCKAKWEFIAELITSIKGTQNDNRVGVIQFDDQNAYKVIGASSPINDLTDPLFNSQPKIDAFYDTIRRRSCDGKNNPSDPDSSLNDALIQAYDMFDAFKSDDAVPPRNKKIMIISNCIITDTTDVCANNVDIIRTGERDPLDQVRSNKDKNGIDVVIVNLPLSEGTNFPDDYLVCLAEYDLTRIFESTGISLPETEVLIPYIEDEVCSPPSPAPTTDPTVDPTADPTIDPTRDPTADPTIDPTTDPTVDPTIDPTADPTRDPTKDPTVDPTADPTRDPTKDPTSDPTKDPTSDPTTDPTKYPTVSPIPECPCYVEYDLDVVFIVDVGCGISEEQCNDQVEGVSEYLVNIKRDASPRTGLIYYGYGVSPLTKITLTDPEFNDLNAAPGSILDKRLELAQRIRLEGQPICAAVDGQVPSTNGLDAAIQEAINQLNSNDILEDGEYRQKKIVIISNCKQDDESGLCTDYGRIDVNEREVEVTVINAGSGVTGSNYLKCLTDQDPNQFIELPDITIEDYDEELKDFTKELCSEPTSDPTADPTNDPTSDPTRDPTSDPTADPTRDPTADPTSDPTKEPTADPTIDPTRDPTSDPTKDPTADPTADPTSDPTADPTKNPTAMPTISPVVGICDELEGDPSRLLDVVVVIDRSTITGENNDDNVDCQRYNNFIAEVVSSFKGDEPVSTGSVAGNPTQVRVAEIIFGTTETPSNIEENYPDQANGNGYALITSLDESNLNTVPGAFMNGFYYRLVEDEPCGGNTTGAGDTANLYDALDAAIKELNGRGRPGAAQKIVIFSTRANTEKQDTICDDFEDRLAPTKSGIDVVMINIPVDKIDDPDVSPFDPFTTLVDGTKKPTKYLACLTNNDESRIGSFLQIGNLRKADNRDPVIDVIQDEICSDPSPSPTSDPTIDPTADPTMDPTADPTTDPTSNPTLSPIACPECICKDDWESDFILLIDTGCVSDDECGDYTEGIAELASTFKPRMAPRVGVITYDGSGTNVVIDLNNTEYNDFAESTLTTEVRREFYQDIRTLGCNGNGGDSTVQQANVVSAIDRAMEMFTYEETTFLPEISCDYNVVYGEYLKARRGIYARGSVEYNAAINDWSACANVFQYCQQNDVKGDCTKRNKKIVLFSACLNTENTAYPDDAPVCTAYSSESGRTPVSGSGEVEISVFNVLTSDSTVSVNSYECLTEGDVDRLYFAGDKTTDLTLDDMVGDNDLPPGSIDRIISLPNELCEFPTQNPTTDPTQAPTEQPTTEPTPAPTDLPTKAPTDSPTPPPVPRCTCKNLAYEFEAIDNSCDNPYGYSRLVQDSYGSPGSCSSCDPNLGCDLGYNCWRYKMKSKKPQCNTCADHKPEYIILPPREDCAPEYDFTGEQYQFIIHDVVDETDSTYGPFDYNYEELFKEDPGVDGLFGPDPRTGQVGIRIPIYDYNYNNEFIFEICLYSVTEMTSNVDIGYGYSVQNCKKSPPEEYGYKCPTNVAFPDLCEPDVMDECEWLINSGYSFAQAVNYKKTDHNPESIKLLGHNDFNYNDNNKHDIFAMFTSYSQMIFIVIMAIFALNILICVYIKCIRKNSSNMPLNKKKYGFIGNNEESDDSDGTDSEIDSDESIDQQLMQ